MNRANKIKLLSTYGYVNKDYYGSLIQWHLDNIHKVTIGGIMCHSEEKSFNAMYDAVEQWMWKTVNDPEYLMQRGWLVN